MSRPLAATVIVGASAAGLAAADGLREGGYDGTITVLDEELQPSYDRPMLSKGCSQPGSSASRLPSERRSSWRPAG
jgi:NADPH-dependent 2,4-dienoyl-CoA reductase/sulfur reductase-like enzyme